MFKKYLKSITHTKMTSKTFEKFFSNHVFQFLYIFFLKTADSIIVILNRFKNK